MQEINKKIEDAVIMKSILKELRYSALAFSKELEYSSHSTIHHVICGRNNISDDLANRIIKKFPQVSYLYIKKGDLPVLLTDKLAQNQANNFKNIFTRVPESISYDLESFAVLKSIDFNLSKIVDLLENKKSDQN